MFICCRYLESNQAITRRKREEAKKLRDGLRDLQCQLDRWSISNDLWSFLLKFIVFSRHCATIFCLSCVSLQLLFAFGDLS